MFCCRLLVRFSFAVLCLFFWSVLVLLNCHCLLVCSGVAILSTFIGLFWRRFSVVVYWSVLVSLFCCRFLVRFDVAVLCLFFGLHCCRCSVFCFLVCFGVAVLCVFFYLSVPVSPFRRSFLVWSGVAVLCVCFFVCSGVVALPSFIGLF